MVAVAAVAVLVPESSEWKEAAKLCMLRLWVSLEFIRASLVTWGGGTGSTV